MQSSVRIRTFLHLERLMLTLDEIDEEAADLLRDLADPLWHSMSAEERSWLEGRGEFNAIIEMHDLVPAPTRKQPDPGGGVKLVLLPDAA